MSGFLSSAWLRVGCGVALLAWLVWQAAQSASLETLRESPPDAAMLGLAWLAIMVALALAFVRWSFVARAAGIELPVLEAMRLGAIGFACNFVALGNVGGDVVKAALLAKPRPGARAAAVTTVVVDRLLGLLGFLLFAAAAIVWTGAAGADQPAALRVLCRATLVLAGFFTLAFLTPFASGRLPGRIAGRLTGVPVVGNLARRVAEIADTYHEGRRWLLAAIALLPLVNGVFILSFYAAAVSLPLEIPSMAEHFFVVPQSVIAGAAPISPNGLGTIEATAEFLYRTLDPDAAVGAGTLAALAHRLAMTLTGVVAAIYYYATRRRNDDAISAAIASETTAEGSGAADAGLANPSRQIV